MQPPKPAAMSALGESFRAAREARGLTLSDVAEQIHIRSVYLAAIEADDWVAIGAPVYVRGFIRTYARFLGIDAEAAVARFAERLPVEPPGGPVAAPASARASATPVRRSSDRPSLWLTAGGIIAAALVVVAGYEYVQFRAAAPGPSLAAAPVTSAPVKPALAPARPPASAPAAPQPKNGLGIRLIERSWLRVTVDGTVAMEGVFPSGTLRTFVGKSATVRAGNAGGVEVTVDGKEAGRLGNAGDVVTRSFHLTGEE